MAWQFLKIGLICGLPFQENSVSEVIEVQVNHSDVDNSYGSEVVEVVVNHSDVDNSYGSVGVTHMVSSARFLLESR